MTSISRRWVVFAAILAAAPALAGCAAGFDANTSKHYAPTEATSIKVKEIVVDQAFILGPDSGGSLPQGGSAPIYLSVVNTGQNSDTLVSATTNGNGTVKIDTPITLWTNKRVSSGVPTPKLNIEGLTKTLTGGESIIVNLQFANTGTVAVTMPVIARSREFATLPPVPGAIAPPSPAPSATPAAPTGH
ncbi:copper chaperone PCu(A)C [Streptosporangium sp. KLBMP 9127]|nr:copper chaperone PCu(A)C [Streptosporangium sp. KLBMP 9127]